KKFWFQESRILKTLLGILVRVVLILLTMQSSSDGFVCEKDAIHCHTSLIIDNAFTMIDPINGPLFVDEGTLRPISQPDKEVSIENVITADGWNTTLPLLTANKSMPGPPIFLYQNQTITIIVQNNLINEAVTIHWHGIDQLGWPAMDGVAFVTQCPILPGQFFNYTFQPRFSGTYWYHSHVGNQRDMGLYGAFIVLKREGEVPINNQHIIHLQEWNHKFGPITLLKANLNNTSSSSESILINGKGEFENNEAPHEVFQLDKSNSHLFRMIGVGSADVLLFSVPGIPLIVKETDGYPFVPKTVNEIIIYPAERYDFELDLKNIREGVYNMTVHILERKYLEKRQNVFGLGLINITNSLSLPVNSSASTSNIKTVLNCPFEVFPNETKIECIPVSFLKSRPSFRLEFDIIPPTQETFTHFLNFGFPKEKEYSSINGKKFIWPTVSALTQPSELNTSCANCDAETSCECTHALNLKSGSEIIMVLSNIGTGAVITHPIHMHGHTFEVLKMGFPSVNETGFLIPNNDIQCSPTLANNKSQCNNATWRNATWNDYRSIPNINVEDPVRKDTIVVPYGGYSIIRIWATNPGVWFMHCHIDQHMIEGMALMLNESFENIGDLPIGLQTCHNFKNQPSAPKSFFQASEENISEMSSATIGLIVTSVILFLALVILSLILLRTCRKLGEPGQSLNMPMSSIHGRE
uniref:Uncharacterized protein n=1 Tax=Magallana gigas TaxID=29159 RepID=A0A8W8NX73_MAGGI